MDLAKRVAKIITLDDVDVQIKRAKKYAVRLKAESKRNDITLAEKIDLAGKAKEAERTLRELRRISWDIDDALAEGKLATSALPSGGA